MFLGDLIILESLTPSVNACNYVSNTHPVPEMVGYSEHFINLVILSKAVTFSASEKRNWTTKTIFLKIPFTIQQKK